MRLSTKAEYGTRAVLDLAIRSGEGPVLVREIAKRQAFSARYLQQQLLPLKVAGLVRATRGAHGGFSLARSPSEIKLSEIIQIMEGSTAPLECVDDTGVCSRADSCITREIWGEMKKAMDGVLESTTLQDLVERQKRKQQSEGSMYHI
ncbi:Rrf2 family transcriptional regulator [Dehalococcoidia bacterium]|nr:Rrf2 family transcriptional regulator [Dehalococcoidia bacterium]MCL0065245.1 Rrf2 family transcriptional regulator [Dehalococcoidia bacterium]MCL0070564.1 Rrf2 family transcriptional regulator [Dehalococcoidia bacterium]